jgi:hypothetical protein
MLLAAATAGLLLAAAETIRWEARVESQARGRNEPTADRRAGLGELDLHGQLRFVAQGADGTAALAYAPSFLLRQVVTGLPAENGNAIRQGGRLELQTRLAPATRLGLRTSLDWGLTDFSPLSGQLTTPSATSLPSQRFVRTLGFEMMVDLTHAFSRRLQLSVAGGLQRSGGVGHAAVSVLPFQVGPQANASLTWTADRMSEIGLIASASESRFGIGRTTLLSDLEGVWTLRAFPHLLLDAAAGLALVRSSGTGTSSGGAYGSGAAGVVWEVPMAPRRALRTSLRLRLLPGVDRFTALAIQTVRAEASAELTEGRLRLGLTGLRGHVIRGSGAGADEIRLEARSSWMFDRAWSLDGGVSAAHTNQLPFAGWQAQALVGLRWADRGSL